MRICFEIISIHGSLQIVLVSNISIVINRVLTYPLADLNYSARTDLPLTRSPRGLVRDIVKIPDIRILFQGTLVQISIKMLFLCAR